MVKVSAGRDPRTGKQSAVKSRASSSSSSNLSSRSLLKNALVFDIETRPGRPVDIWDVIDHPSVAEPFDENQELWCDGEFDPSLVQLGSAKKQETIDRKIEEAREHFEHCKANRDSILAELRAAHEMKVEAKAQEIIGKAALNAETCRVLVIGYLDVKADHFFTTHDNFLIDEADVIREFWKHYEAANCMVGLNIFRFDLPVLIRRSWILGVPVPRDVMERDRFWNQKFIDLAARWSCGNHGDYISLDRLARAMGVGRKNGDGADFYKLWESDRAAAMKYLENDVRLPLGCAMKMDFA